MNRYIVNAKVGSDLDRHLARLAREGGTDELWVWLTKADPKAVQQVDDWLVKVNLWYLKTHQRQWTPAGELYADFVRRGGTVKRKQFIRRLQARGYKHVKQGGAWRLNLGVRQHGAETARARE
jgi:hypothetical protein